MTAEARLQSNFDNKGKADKMLGGNPNMDKKDSNLGRTLRNAAMAGVLAVTAAASGSVSTGPARGSGGSEKQQMHSGKESSEVLPQLEGYLQIIFSDGSKLICPDPKYIKENGYVPGLLMPGPDSKGSSLPFLCDPGEQDLSSILPGQTVESMAIVNYDGVATEVECPTGKIDLSNPQCVPVDQGR